MCYRWRHCVRRERKVLWVFERQVYPEVNPEPEQQLRQAMRHAVLSDGDEVEPRVAITVALANSAKLLPQIFSKQELKDRKERIKQLENGELISKAAKEAVQAIEAAVMIAVIMPAITAATVTSNPGAC
ncbi:GOLPH3/VPS74 family protein [Idiomarina sp. HP20-50]|uniref:GOLPH3/VPS74 family protein n=1 Tax=Idiomarina sp. HP20-50 TaxID=3070813 RepID=UPI00294ABCB7|nr:GPP34 family phosphoprotein [Idiomarina sp. HP20-50]MDV6314906.1 GPP34 family phosphoprotein [Idiomarina sp. HP20-50]